MTRFPHDQFAKDFLESLLSPLGQVQTSLKISGEVRHAQAQTLRWLNRRVGDMSAEILARVNGLPLERLDDLHDAALDFTNVSDLIAWLDLNEWN